MTKTIGEALFPQVKRQLLGLLFGDPGKRYYGREIARRIAVSYGTVIRELKTLVDAEIVVSETDGPHTYYRANPNCAVYSDLVGLVTKTFGLKDVLGDALSSLQDRIDFAAIFGSVAKGEESGSSDVDVLVVGDIRLRDLVGVLETPERTLNRSLNPVLYPPAEFTQKYEDENHFVRSLIQTELLFLIGTHDDLRRLVGDKVAKT